jgi:sigma-B regulation protein RsbU (phosphoserine phosphatase)
MEARPIRTLLIEDDANDVFFIRRTLGSARGAKFIVTSVERLADGLALLAQGGFDVLVLDLGLPDSRGPETLAKALKIAGDIPVLVLSSLDDEEIALKVVHEGAQDYLSKSQIPGQLLSRAIIYAIERAQAKIDLGRAEKKFRAIYENSVEGIFQTTPDGHYLSANPALSRIYGYNSPEELMSGLTDIEKSLYVEPGRRAEFIRLMQEHDVVTDFESRVRRKDGSIIWISENVRSVRDEKGNLLYYEGTVEDVTQRERALEQLRHSEALYHSLVETLPQNIFRKDVHRRFTFANKRFCNLLGRPLEEILGQTDFDFFPDELARKYQNDDRTVLATGKSIEVVEEHQPPGAEKQYVQVVKTPIYDGEGEIIGLQCIFWDITARKRAEERELQARNELARSQEELRKKNEAMQEDLQMAQEIQQAILPGKYPSFPPNAPAGESRLRFCHRYRPSGEVGGDFFNILPLSDSCAGLFLCDVMGHGVRPALITTMIRAMVEELRPVGNDPGQMLTRVNQDLRAILQQTGAPFFTTACYLVADLEKKTLLWANAGHPKPILVRRASNSADTLQSPDAKSQPALGLFPSINYIPWPQDLAEGDLIIVYTDGLYEVEGKNRTLYDPQMLLDAIRRRIQLPAAQIFDELIAEVKSFAADGQFDDDVCIVGMEVVRL